jgi:site-specific DNA-cytosine methylase|tara:strand:+ start:776 stop:1738 length:963 start_codon:yes stop_codon:yes gene_type:complete
MKVFDIFSGSGGYSLGFEQSGMETVAFCEYEEYAKRVLKKNWQGVPIYGDVTTVTGEDLKRDGVDFDLICGGFPCQDISIAGKNKGIIEGERSGLWREFRRLIDETKPKYAVIENVSALLSRGLNVILQDLAEIGYDATWTMCDSQYFGVPQRRRRVYILAVRDGIPEGADIFGFVERSDKAIQSKTLHIQESRPWNFEQGCKDGYPFAFFTRQRSDQFGEKGVASTILKRDYKDFTDLVLDSGGLRKLAVNERLALQGYPTDFFDGCDLSNMQLYMLNGMTVPVVKWLGDRIMNFDRQVTDGTLVPQYEKPTTLEDFFI